MYHHLFISNKYTRWYFHIIDLAKIQNVDDQYYEKHHIIPKALDGFDEKSNIVLLTPREHFICHWLLTKMISNSFYKFKMLKAFTGMLNWKTKRNLSARQYEIIKLNVPKPSENSKLKASEFMRGQKWWYHNGVQIRAIQSPGPEWTNGRLVKYTRKSASNKTREQMSKSAKARGSNNVKKCTDGILQFDSIAALANYYNIPHSSASSWVRNNKRGFSYL